MSDWVSNLLIITLLLIATYLMFWKGRKRIRKRWGPVLSVLRADWRTNPRLFWTRIGSILAFFAVRIAGRIFGIIGMLIAIISIAGVTAVTQWILMPKDPTEAQAKDFRSSLYWIIGCAIILIFLAYTIKSL